MDTDSGQEIRRLEQPLGCVSHFVISPNGLSMAVASNGGLEVWEVPGFHRILRKEEYYPWALSENGRLLLAERDKQVFVLAVASGEEFWSSSRHDLGLLTAAMASNGHVVTVDRGNVIRVWQQDSDDILHEVALRRTPGSTPIDNVSFSADSSKLLAGNSQQTYLWDTSTWKLVGQWNGHSAIFTKDSRAVILGGPLRVVDLHSARESAPFSGPYDEVYDWGGQYCIAPSPTEPILALGTGSTIVLADLVSGKILGELLGTKHTYKLEFTSDGKHLLAYYRASVGVWDVATGKMTHELDGYGITGNLPGLSPNGRRVITQTGAFPPSTRTRYFWDVATGTMLGELPCP